MLMQRLPPETHFCIASNDSDLDHVVHLLTSQGRSAQRFSQALAAPTATPAPTAKSPAEHIQAYCQRLLKQQQGRPARQETLLNSIRTSLKITPEEAKEVFYGLRAHQVITLNAQKVTYNEAQLKAYA
jgi:hypothetical protein